MVTHVKGGFWHSMDILMRFVVSLLPHSLEWQFKTFSTQLTSAICFLLVLSRCLTSHNIKIETMKAHHLYFLPSDLQIYFYLSLFFSPSFLSRSRKCPFSKLPFLWMYSQRPQSFSESRAGPCPANLSLDNIRGLLQGTLGFLLSLFSV